MLKTQRAIVAAMLLLVYGQQAGAVSISRETFEANDGSTDDPEAGFATAIALAHEPQFASTVMLTTGGSIDDGGYGQGTAVWIGNRDRDGTEVGYFLAAAHQFYDDDDALADPTDYTVVTEEGDVYAVTWAELHPDYDEHTWAPGTDLAVFTVDRPVEGLGEEPMLNCSADETGLPSVVTGYGWRMLGDSDSIEELNDRFVTVRAAVRNRIEFNPEAEFLNQLLTDFDPSEGNPDDFWGTDGGAPIDDLEGISTKGDSGGPLWIQEPDADDGEPWAIAGIVSGGDGAKYGVVSAHARISMNLDFIERLVPEVSTIDQYGEACPAWNEGETYVSPVDESVFFDPETGEPISEDEYYGADD